MGQFSVAGGAGVVAVIGGGPAGLMAAEACAQAGCTVHVYDAMPSVGRKFLLAGRGGLNLTHAEADARFRARFGDRAPTVSLWLDVLSPQALRDWAAALGVDTFVGSSGRVFPAEMKAAPLLRAWVARLRAAGVVFYTRHRLVGLRVPSSTGSTALLPEVTAQGNLDFETPSGVVSARADAVVLACGGASWSRLGSDGRWVDMLRQLGVDVADLVPANCGFDVAWSAHFATRYAGEPVKNIRAWLSGAGPGIASEPSCADTSLAGEAMISTTGIEGGLVYACSSSLRDALARTGAAQLVLDLLPDLDAERVASSLARGRGAKSWSSHLQGQIGLKGVKAGLLRECAPASAWESPAELARLIKRLPINLTGTRPIDEAISSAGGVRIDAMDTGLQCAVAPGVFCAGEMIDWEAPTGGYLLSASMASGRVAGRAAAALLGCQAPASTPD